MDRMKNNLNAHLNTLDEAKNDSTTEVMRNYWARYSNFTKQIIIIEPNAALFKLQSSMVKLLRDNQNLDEYYIPEKDWEKEVNPGWWRTLASIDKCEICSTVSVRELFCHKDKKCDIYDRRSRFMLYCDFAHVNSLGSEKIMKTVVDRISKKLIF